ncbi:TetR family transcriptional regulator [Candidatus Berkiella aquae]|uniref:TetR/AcrR family transcriptional regulator n=1 Tax=Candidatus Berkiella aquae TaxID=295108 RepID=A0A0Q9YIB3_9GAMM|nr:TetR/AcrR family transcriptional regulator [Candidatus Berkiella aquae]MCS5711713.1 TetR/AcrR family transcriptional regulator [Candidatus Berkiella aquae]
MNKISAHHTKQKLIDTASDLIWKNSYGSVSVDDICKTAGVKKGSFYHFFPSKIDLVLASMDAHFQSKKAVYDSIFSPQTPPLQRFEQLADFLYEMQAEAVAKHGKVCGCPYTTLGSEMAGQEDVIRHKLNELTKCFERYYENAIRDLIIEGLLPEKTNVKTKSQEIFTYFIGVFTLARIQNDLELLKRDLKPGLLKTLGLKDKLQEQ